MNEPQSATFSLAAINQKRSLSVVSPVLPSGVFTLHEHLRPVTETAVRSSEVSAPAVKLPFDPLRLIDALLRRWWLPVAGGVACSAMLVVAGHSRFETTHTANAHIVKQSAAATLRQSETGETFKPQDFSIPTLTALMYSGTVVTDACARLNNRFSEQTLRSGLVIAPERNTEVVHLSMRSEASAEDALEMLKAYTDSVLQLALNLQRDDATAMKHFLEGQLSRTEADLVKINEEMLAYGKEAQLIDAEKQMDAWLGELGNFSLKYETLRLDHETLDLRIQGIEQELGKMDTSASRLDQVRQELAELRVRYTDEHPTVIESREKVAALQAQAATSTGKIDTPPKPGDSSVAESLYLDLVRLRSEKKVMAEQLQKLAVVRDTINQRLEQLPRKAMEYARIKARHQTLETSRGLLAGRHREAALHEENAHGYLRLFAMARLQDVKTVKPTQKLMMAGAGGFAGGAVLVAAAIIGLTLLDGRILTTSDMNRATGLPVIGLLSFPEETKNENEELWAFRTWTRLQPLLYIPGYGGAAVCGMLHDGGDDSAGQMARRLASAVVRRGHLCVTITRLSSGTALRLTDAVRHPECLNRVIRELPGSVCELVMDEAWIWSMDQRRQWHEAMAYWRNLHGVVVLIELPPADEPDALLLAEQLPNLVWAGASGHSRVRQVSDTLRMYRDAGCRLVLALLERTPVLRPAFLARFALLLALGLSPLHADTPLGPGDSVSIMMPGFLGHERMDVPIGPDGKLTYLQARNIEAAGLSLDELREKLTAELHRFYRNARVVVTPAIFQSRKVYVLGKVVKKGAINLDRPLSVLEVVAEAGGLETGLFQRNTVELADLSRSFVMRGDQRLAVDLEALFLRGDMSQNAQVEAGDYLYFPSSNSNMIYVLGDVKNQGAQGLLTHTSVHSAIAQAGGFTSKAYTQRLLVIRGSLHNPQRLVVDMNDILNARAKDIRLEPMDIIYIADRPWARAEDLLDMAINAFLQGAVAGWTQSNIGPFIKQPLLPQLK